MGRVKGSQRTALSDKDKRKARVLFILFLSVVLVLFIVGEWSKEKFKMTGINGRIERIEFSDKGMPIIYIHGKDFYLNHYDASLRKYIFVGDSVHKASGTFDLYVFRMRNDSAFFRYYYQKTR